MEMAGVNCSGGNLTVPFKKAVTITGYSVSVSMGFLTGTGFCETLVMGVLTPGAPTFSPDDYHYITGPTPLNGDIGASVPSGKHVPQGQIFAADLNTVFSAILKTTAPQAKNVVLAASGLNISVPAGSYLTVHMDTMSIDAFGRANQSLSALLEIQGVMYYT
jgi:hypothetical protein